jgi:hypothetical protein
MHGAINLIWKISVGAEFVLAFRLLVQGLAGEYPALFAGCLVFPIKSLLLMASYWSTMSPPQTRQIAQNLGGLDGLLGAWIVYELFSRWTANYSGIGRFGKALLVVLVLGSIGISSLTSRQEWTSLDFVSDFRIYFILHRIFYTVLGLFLLGMWLFFRNFPVAIAPNIVRHTHLAIFYFVGNALAELAYTIGGGGRVLTERSNLAIVSITALSFGAWAVLLTRRGQIRPPAQVVSSEDRARIQRINDELLGLMGGISKP